MKEDLKKKGDKSKDSSSPHRDSVGDEADPQQREREKKLTSLNSSSSIAQKLEECQQQRDEYLAGWQRSKADFINHKKEEMERMEMMMKYAKEEMVLKLIPILDNFDLVEKSLSEEEKGEEKIKGILQIKSQVKEILKMSFVEEINIKETKFDPNFHEAIEQVESDQESGTILEELQKGYLMNGKVIKPSKVKVAK